MNITETLRSGYVLRWHTNPEMNHATENLAQHQWAVAMIVQWLYPDASKDLIMAALTHDVGELRAGDLSHDFKRDNPEFAEQHDIVETIFRENICGADPALDHDEHTLLKIADWLAAWDYMTRIRPGLRNRSDWLLQRMDVGKLAEDMFGGEMLARINEFTTNRINQLAKMGD